MKRTRGEAICDSLFCTLAVALPISLAVVFYRHDIKSLLRALFVVFLVFCLFLVSRHSFYRLAYRVKAALKNRSSRDARVEVQGTAGYGTATGGSTVAVIVQGYIEVFEADVTVGYFRIFSVSRGAKSGSSTAILETRALMKRACFSASTVVK